MRIFLVFFMALSVSVIEPVIPQAAHGATLFDILFPRAAERRKERLRAQQLKQKKRKRPVRVPKVAKVKGPSFKTYYARKVQPVKLVRLAKAFSAYDLKLVAAEALRQEKIKSATPENNEPQIEGDSPLGITPDGPSETEGNVIPISAKPTDGSVETTAATGSVAATQEASELPEIRLSAAQRADLQAIRISAAPKLGAAVVDYYKSNPEFLWLDENGQPNEKGQMILSVLADAANYGLRNEDYELSLFAEFSGESDGRVRSAVQLEFSITVAALQYMADARHGLVDPNRLSDYHDFSNIHLNYKKAFAELAGDDAPNVLMLSMHPQMSAFSELRNELSRLREAAEGFDTVTVAPGTFVRPGQTNDQLENIVESIRRKSNADLREKHFDVFAVDHSEGVYSDDVVAMVRDFQRMVGLKADGIVGKNTLSRMQADDPKQRYNKVLLAMERLRWHPDRFGNRYVFINQPAYRATYMANGKAEVSMRTVVGKPSNQTYFFHDQIEYVEYNPYWGIPRSILVNEMLPKLRRNPSYFDDIGYEMTDQRGNYVFSYEVNWHAVGANFPYNVRQPPGAKNALGELKIMFPNKHSIYMHDTPAKSLFKREKRAYSHGCVRLAEPRKMAAAVLGTSMNEVEQRLLGGNNNRQKLKAKIPVYVAYFTAWPEQDGGVKFFSDIYGRDKALLKALKMEHGSRDKARSI